MLNLKDSKIIIIEDKYSDVKPLLSFLSSKGLSYTYFDKASPESLPSSTMTDVRCFFIDMDLGFNLDDKNKVSTLVTAISKIISPENGPYLLFGWTKHPELIKSVVDSLDNKIKPIYSESINKLDYFETVGNAFEFQEGKEVEFETFLNNVFNREEFKFLNYFLIWKDILNKSSNKIIHNLWNNNTEQFNKFVSSLIKKLALAYFGKHPTTNSEKIKGSLKVLDEILIHEFDTFLSEAEIPESLLLMDETCEIDNSRLNSKLLLDNTNKKFIPGIVIKSNDEKNKIMNELFDLLGLLDSLELSNTDRTERKEIIKNSMIGILIELSPVCDHAQKKWKSARLVRGLLIPSEHEEYIKNHAKYCYSSDMEISYNDVKYIICLDFRFLINKPTSYVPDTENILFTIRKTLLNDIQNKFANHSSRIGVTYVSHN